MEPWMEHASTARICVDQRGAGMGRAIPMEHLLIGSYIRFIRSCVFISTSMPRKGRVHILANLAAFPVLPSRGTRGRPFHICRLLSGVWTTDQHPIRRSLSRLLNYNDGSFLSDRMRLLPMLLLPLSLLLLLPLLLLLLLLPPSAAPCCCPLLPLLLPSAAHAAAVVVLVAALLLPLAKTAGQLLLLLPALSICCCCFWQQHPASCSCCCPRCLVSSTLDSTIVSSTTAAQDLKPRYSTTRF